MSSSWAGSNGWNTRATRILLILCYTNLTGTISYDQLRKDFEDVYKQVGKTALQLHASLPDCRQKKFICSGDVRTGAQRTTWKLFSKNRSKKGSLHDYWSFSPQSFKHGACKIYCLFDFCLHLLNGFDFLNMHVFLCFEELNCLLTPHALQQVF